MVFSERVKPSQNCCATPPIWPFLEGAWAMAMGLLVGHLGDLVRTRRGSVEEPSAPPSQGFSPALHQLRERLGHHLVLLALMARIDGDYADSERQVIVDYCAKLASLNADERAMLNDYLRSSRPSLVQLDPALRQLEAEDAGSIAGLMDAAERLIRADGRLDPAELRLLERMRHELATRTT